MFVAGKYDNSYVWTEKQCTDVPEPTPSPTAVQNEDPTIDPNAAPTPEENTICTFKIVDGSAPNDAASTCSEQPDFGRPDVLNADPGEAVAGTRCCTYDGSSGDSFCDGSCSLVTFAEAEARCLAQSMRLCTETEVLAGVVAATGCKSYVEGPCHPFTVQASMTFHTFGLKNSALKCRSPHSCQRHDRHKKRQLRHSTKSQRHVHSNL